MAALINIDVPDLHAAIAFYELALGLRLARLLFDGTVAELAGAGVPIMLLQKDAGSSPVPCAPLSRDYRRHWTPIHLDFPVANIDDATSRALAAGAVLEGPLQDFPWGRQACLADPFGHGFCLLEWKYGGYR